MPQISGKTWFGLRCLFQMCPCSVENNDVAIWARCTICEKQTAFMMRSTIRFEEDRRPYMGQIMAECDCTNPTCWDTGRCIAEDTP